MKQLPKLFIAVLLLTFFTPSASAQFTIRPVTQAAEKSTDTVRLKQHDTPTPLNLSMYSEAYERYLRRERFKFRNKMKIRTSLGITQTSFDNWAAGGSNNFSGRVWAQITHTYNDPQTSFNILSVVEGAYTMVITDNKASKSEDFFNINITPSWKFAPRWELSGSLIVKSQFSASFVSPGDTLISSSFFAPATVTLSAGITYSPPKGRFKIFVAPLSGNMTLVLDNYLADKGGFGMPAGQRIKSEFGAFVRINFTQPLFKETTLFETKLESFWNYATTPTLWWESRLSFKLHKLFGLSLYFKVLYDETVSTPRAYENNFWQINESFGFNLTFNFDSKPNTVSFDQIGVY